MPEFLAVQRVEIVASLPCYLEENVDAQRGDRAFNRSIEVLRQLNGHGYGAPGTGLELTLVYNPVGTALPPSQLDLEQAYRRELAARYGIVFNRLIAITNMPIGRFLEHLHETGEYDQYMERLIGAYNPAAATGVMCRTTLSVDWEGRLYDCDLASRSSSWHLPARSLKKGEHRRYGPANEATPNHLYPLSRAVSHQDADDSAAGTGRCRPTARRHDGPCAGLGSRVGGQGGGVGPGAIRGRGRGSDAEPLWRFVPLPSPGAGRSR